MVRVLLMAGMGIFGCIGGIGSESFADELSSQEKILIESVTKSAQSTAAPECVPEQKVSCTQLSDQFCEKLWKKPNQGNLEFGESKILLGRSKSKKSELSMARILDTEALVGIQKNLPQDVRAKTDSIVEELKKHLEKEEDTESWYKKQGRLLTDYWDEVEEVARERVLARYPELKDLKKADYNFDQRAKIDRELTKVNREITELKYANHSNWKKVQSTYSNVIKDLLAEVEQLPMADEQREIIKKKLNSVELVLPVQDASVMSLSKGCDSTEVNAFYSPNYNKFTVCAGFFNSLQDEGALYTVIAHEVAHSVDGANLKRDESDRSGVAKKLQPFCRAKGPAMSCEAWKTFKDVELKIPDQVQEPQMVWRELADCLKPSPAKPPAPPFTPFDKEILNQVAARIVKDEVEYYTSNKYFSLLATPLSEGVNLGVMPNDYYLRPDRLRGGAAEQSKARCLGEVDLELFVQILECQEYPKASKQERANVFKKAVQEFKEVDLATTFLRLQDCGRECRDNDMFYALLSRPSGEEIADWLAKRTLARRVERESSLEKRREMAFSATAFLCERPGVFYDAADLLKAEKEMNNLPHPAATARRHSFMTPRMGAMIGCEAKAPLGSENACEMRPK